MSSVFDSKSTDAADAAGKAAADGKKDASRDIGRAGIKNSPFSAESLDF